MYTIYALIDPLTQDVRYVGRSVCPKERLRAHINGIDTNSSTKEWIRSLAGSVPILDILEAEVPKEIIKERENFWIKKMLASGCQLTNFRQMIFETEPNKEKNHER